MKIVDISERMPIGVRSFKHTPLALGAFLPDIISGGAGILSSLIGGFSQNKSVADTNATNLQIARETNKMQLDAMHEQNKFNRDTALEMFNLENAYNTPGAQAARLLEYGFNPGVALGNGAVGASMASASAPTSSGLPTFVNPTMQSPPSVLMSAVDSISKLAGAAAQFSQARKTSKETSWIDQEMEANIKDLFADIKSKEVQSSYDEFRLSVDKVFAPFERAIGMRKLADQIKNLGMEYTLAMSRNETEKANKLLADAQTKLVDSNNDQVKQSTPIIIDNLKKTGQNIVSQTNANNSSAALDRQLIKESVSRQDLNEQQHKFVEETWSWSKAGIEASVTGQQLSNIYDRETIIARIENTLKLPGLTEESIRELQERRKALEKSNSVFTKRFALEVLSAILGSYESLSRTGKNQSDAVSNAVPYFLQRR